MPSISDIVDGCGLPVLLRHANNPSASGDLWTLAEILSIKEGSKGRSFYVHYIDFNKRLDQWVPESSLTLRNVQWPKVRTCWSYASA
jgi:hypothetical protein